MVQINEVFQRFPRIVRDIARDLDKDIDLIMTGPIPSWTNPWSSAWPIR
jgi:hypothetical protein